MKNTVFPHTSSGVTARGFSIIEVMVGIFIFSLGLVSVYALLVTSLRVNDYNSNAIIASNLAREQIEIIRNIRDTNYKKNQVWNLRDPKSNQYTEVIKPGIYYLISQDITSGDTQMKEISGVVEGQENLAQMQSYRVCLDDIGYYVYCDGAGVDARETPFYKYVHVEIAQDAAGNDLSNAYKITSKVIWYKRGYYDFSIETILADSIRI